MDNTQSGYSAWLPVAAVALAIVTRLYFANRPEIGLDDAISADISALPLAATLRFAAWNEPTMGFYYLVLNLWVKIAGESPLALRMLSIVFSVAAVPAIYFLADALFGRATGAAAALILAANATAAEYAQTVRSYSLAVLLIIASSFYFVRLIGQVPAKRGDSWRYAATGALAVYAHMHAAFTLAAHALSACFRRDTPWRTLIACGLAVIAAAAPLPLITFGHYQGQSDWITRVTLISVAKLFPFLFGATFFQKTPAAIALLLLSLALIASAAMPPRTIPRRWNLTFALCGLLVPIALCALLSLVKPAFLGEARYLLGCLPFAVMLMAAGLNKSRRPEVALCALLALELWQVAVRPAEYQSPRLRTCWSEATDYILSNSKPGDGVVQAWKYDAWLYWYYDRLYYRRSGPGMAFPAWNGDGFSVNGVYIDNPAIAQYVSAAWFERQGTKYRRLWVVIDPRHDDSTAALLASLPPSRFHPQSERTFPDGLRVVLIGVNQPLNVHARAS
jgi:mannosyltransferase